jgi:hypothetical protein
MFFPSLRGGGDILKSFEDEPEFLFSTTTTTSINTPKWNNVEGEEEDKGEHGSQSLEVDPLLSSSLATFSIFEEKPNSSSSRFICFSSSSTPSLPPPPSSQSLSERIFSLPDLPEEFARGKRNRVGEEDEDEDEGKDEGLYCSGGLGSLLRKNQEHFQLLQSLHYPTLPPPSSSSSSPSSSSFSSFASASASSSSSSFSSSSSSTLLRPTFSGLLSDPLLVADFLKVLAGLPSFTFPNIHPSSSSCSSSCSSCSSSSWIQSSWSGGKGDLSVGSLLGYACVDGRFVLGIEELVHTLFKSKSLIHQSFGASLFSYLLSYRQRIFMLPQFLSSPPPPSSSLRNTDSDSDSDSEEKEKEKMEKEGLSVVELEITSFKHRKHLRYISSICLTLFNSSSSSSSKESEMGFKDWFSRGKLPIFPLSLKSRSHLATWIFSSQQSKKKKKRTFGL